MPLTSNHILHSRKQHSYISSFSTDDHHGYPPLIRATFLPLLPIDIIHFFPSPLPYIIPINNTLFVLPSPSSSVSIYSSFASAIVHNFQYFWGHSSTSPPHYSHSRSTYVCLSSAVQSTQPKNKTKTKRGHLTPSRTTHIPQCNKKSIRSRSFLLAWRGEVFNTHPAFCRCDFDVARRRERCANSPLISYLSDGSGLPFFLCFLRTTLSVCGVYHPFFVYTDRLVACRLPCCRSWERLKYR